MEDIKIDNYTAGLYRDISNNMETAKLLKESLKIVDELAKMDADEIFANDDDMEDLEKLIEKAKRLTKNRLWKLT